MPPYTYRRSSSTKPRARDLGLTFGRFKTGQFNAITDVPGVLVGHKTLRDGPICTGLTAIVPNNGNVFQERVIGSGFVLNGAGEISGLTQVMEWGLIETPIMLTNTMSVGAVSEGVVAYLRSRHSELRENQEVVIPVVGECDDSWLNDAGESRIESGMVGRTIESAKSGPVEEGAVGGGTGMITCDFKGGIGTSSRKLPDEDGGYTLGVLVMSNFGEVHNLRVDGIPVGQMLASRFEGVKKRVDNYGSIIVVLATDAPLLQHQLSRVCKRAALGVGASGSYAAHGSGEIMIGFSSANRVPRTTQKKVVQMSVLLNSGMDPLYEAAMDATHEAIVNALFAAETVEGRDGNTAPALPAAEVAAIVRKVRSMVPGVTG